MAKSDSFFIRAKTNTNGTTYAQSSVDLGAYVDALGKSVLRIHNIEVQYGAPLELVSGAPTTTTRSGFQLTTQSQTALVGITDKSVIASGSLTIATNATNADFIQDTLDVGPQRWTKGYLVGVEQIYLGVDQTFDHVDEISIMLECTVETLSQAGAMALALSQQ